MNHNLGLSAYMKTNDIYSPHPRFNLKNHSATTGLWPFTQEKSFEVKVGPENRDYFQKSLVQKLPATLFSFALRQLKIE